jgi:hypothetical protein
MTDLSKRCLGFECETAKNCTHFLRARHPHDVFFMPAKSGKECNTYEPYFDQGSDHDND